MTGTIQPLRVEVKCFGTYTFKISDPATFMRQIAGTAEEYRKEDIIEQMRSEVVGSFQKVLNELGNSNYKVPVLELPSQTDTIKKAMDDKVFDQPIRDRGISIVGFVVESVTLDDESEKKIDDYELSSNSFMQQGKLTGSFGSAVEGAANNPNGAGTGMMGVGMVNMASGGVMGAAVGNAFNGQGVTVQDLQGGNAQAGNIPAEGAAFCPKCGAPVNGANFCPKCGNKLN